ncbi:unnamed protein product [Strongylus vulgaris]|nr:unnamed protein product [Strongylus vulgaris]
MGTLMTTLLDDFYGMLSFMRSVPALARFDD